jgi:hypothetical protein
MNNSVGEIALAFMTVYKALPEEVRAEVRRLLRELDESEFERNEEWQHLSQASFAEEWDKPENAYWDVHLTNPSRMDNHVQAEEPLTPTREQEQVERVQRMENVVAPLREPLPKDYKFDREEANER